MFLELLDLPPFAISFYKLDCIFIALFYVEQRWIFSLCISNQLSRDADWTTALQPPLAFMAAYFEFIEYVVYIFQKERILLSVVYAFVSLV